jgi:CubicO group peptidase (beta-lactamase class C family)
MTAVMLPTSRRNFLRGAGGAALLAGIGPAPAAFARITEGVAASERHEIAALAAGYMAEFGAPGLSVAIAHHGRLAYAEGFGLADPAAGQRVAPPNLFRIASVSKPVTSVAVFSLIEQGRLSLSDKVFGRTGILRNEYGAPRDRRIEQITVEQLLTHTCGGWPNKGRDPMFSNPDFDQRRLIAWTLANVPLNHAPGTAYAYSNFGYCLLGRVIEKVTGQRYGAYVRDAVLKPCGVTGMRIGAGPRAARAAGEVVYAGQGGDPYRVKVARADSCGGWIASASDLARFAMNIGGGPGTPGILRPHTVAAMTAPSAVNPGYAKGWIVNAQRWWHNGSLPGTSAIMVSTRSGLAWAALANTRRRDPSSVAGLNRVAGQMVRAVASFAG